MSEQRTAPITVDAIVDRAGQTDIHRRVLAVFERLEPDRHLEESMQSLRHAIETPRPYWDLCCALAACTERLRPRAYLEIGVRRGRSAAVVAAGNPDIHLYLFDMWYPDYAGVPNPGPDFVRSELAKVGHRGGLRFVTGRSPQTVPAFFADPGHPQQVDLITVDGDHRDEGARTDLTNVRDRLARPGVLLFDDISHPAHSGLGKVWSAVVARHDELQVRENRTDATGTAVAMRPE